MRKFIIAGVAALSLFGMAACGEGAVAKPVITPAEPSTDSSATTAPVELTQDQKDSVYITVLDSEGIYYSSEENALNAAHSLCTYMSQGGTFENAVLTIESSGDYTEYQSGYIFGAATSAFCPEYAHS